MCRFNDFWTTARVFDGSACPLVFTPYSFVWVTQTKTTLNSKIKYVVFFFFVSFHTIPKKVEYFWVGRFGWYWFLSLGRQYSWYKTIAPAKKRAKYNMFNLVLISPRIIGCASLIYSKRALEKKKLYNKKPGTGIREFSAYCIFFFSYNCITSNKKGKKRPHLIFFVQFHMTVILWNEHV